MLNKHTMVPSVRKGTWILFVAIVYALIARLSLLLAFEDSNATPVWPPSGFALAMVLLLGRRIVPGIFVGAFTANLVVFISNHTTGVSDAIWLSLLIAAGNTAEALTGNYLLKKLIPSDGRGNYFHKVRHWLLFVFAAFLMSMLAASVGTGAVGAAGIVTFAEISYVWRTWLIGDVSGILLFTPLIVVWVMNPQIRFDRKELLETAALFLAVIVSSGIIFFDWFFSTPMSNWVFWIIPVLVWAALRLKTREMISAMVLFSIMAILGTATNHGAFSNLPTNNGLLIVQAFVSIMIATKLALNISISEHRKTLNTLNEMHGKLETRIEERTAELRHEKEFIESLFNSIEDLMAVFDTAGYYITVNRKVEELYGLKKNDVVGKHVLELVPSLKDSDMYAYLRRATGGETIYNVSYFSNITGRYFENSFIPLKRGEGNIYGVLLISHDVTQSRKLENKFRSLVESSPDATVFVNKDGNIVLINSQAEKLFGYERTELEGRQVELLIPSRFHERHPLHRDGFAAAPKVRGMGADLDLFARKKDGTEFPVEISLSPIETEEGMWYSSSIRDISLRKKTEEEIKKINNQLTEAQRLSHLGSWEWDIEKDVLTWSDEMFRIFGLARERSEWEFENFIQSVHSEDRKMVIDIFQSAIKKREPFDFCYRIVRPGGRERILQSRGELLISSLDESLKMKGSTQDVTEMKLAEASLKAKSEELVMLNYSLHASNRELQLMNTELSTFAYVASHDLQEPLRKIQTFASRILESESALLSPTGKDYLQRMHKSVRRVHVLLEDLLAYSRLNSSEKVFENIDLNKILEEEKEELKELIQDKKATIDSMPLPSVHVIPFQMRMLFFNVLVNSLKFSDPLRHPHIRIHSQITSKASLPEGAPYTSNEYHRISFSDNGIGFEPHFKERIFEVFQRLHGNNTYPGTGIGLAICKKIVENHFGIITAEGEPDKGATFHIYLPVSNTGKSGDRSFSEQVHQP